MLVGGGTGGHITPLLAVAHELKTKDSDVRTVLVAEKHARFEALANSSSYVDEQRRVRAGKFRRYHGESWYTKILDVKTFVQNASDFFKTIGGFFDALKVIRDTKPDVAFIKGGFVSVPVGLACAIKRVPYITHDSDALPGLANRIISRWARFHAVGMPAEFYPYPKGKMQFVGIPLGSEWHSLGADDIKHYRRELHIPTDARVLCITGGSLGAERLNAGIEPVVTALIKDNPDLHVLHQTGDTKQKLYAQISSGLKERIKVKKFVDKMYVFTGSADVVLTRAGATTIAELSTQHKAVVLVPNPLLTGGHQLKNAKHLEELDAAEVITEAMLHNTTEAIERISSLLRSPERRQELGRKLGNMAKQDATSEIAAIVWQVAKKRVG